MLRVNSIFESLEKCIFAQSKVMLWTCGEASVDFLKLCVVVVNDRATGCCGSLGCHTQAVLSADPVSSNWLL